MVITKEQLLNLRDQAVAKRQAYLDMIQQADGAIGLINLLLDQLSETKAGNENAPDTDRNE